MPCSDAQQVATACEGVLSSALSSVSQWEVARQIEVAKEDEGFFGVLKRERVHRVRYHTWDVAKSDLFDYIDECIDKRNDVIWQFCPSAC